MSDYILTGFLLARLSSTDRDVLRSLITTNDLFISPYNSIIFFFFLHYVFWCSVLRDIPVQDYDVFLKTDPFIIIWCLSLSLVSFLVLNSALSNINIVNPCFFGSVLAWYILIHLSWVYLCFLFVVDFLQRAYNWEFLVYPLWHLFFTFLFRPFTFKVITAIVVLIATL